MTSTHVGQLRARTPCADFDVRSLLGQLIGTAHRGLATARGNTTRGIPHLITDVLDGELALAYATLAASIREAWLPLAGAETLTAPWGTCTALEAARGFTVETVTRGWNLAFVPGQGQRSLS